jgi:hypothetical protein
VYLVITIIDMMHTEVVGHREILIASLQQEAIQRGSTIHSFARHTYLDLQQMLDQ